MLKDMDVLELKTVEGTPDFSIRRDWK